MSAIFDLDSTDAIEVKVDGKTFFIKALSAFERDVFETQWLEHKQPDSVIGIRPFMVAFCLCDEEGKKEFCSGNSSRPRQDFVEAVEKIGNLPAGKVQPLFSAAMTLNGFSDEEVEELEKK
jgi:hypothetical protein